MTSAKVKRSSSGLPRVLALFAILLLLIAGAVVMGWMPRASRQKALVSAARLAEDRPTPVNVVEVHAAAGNGELELPGDLQALIESPLYARVDGYLQKRLVDIGDRVTKGQLLAEIDTPELDMLIKQARSAFTQAQAGLNQIKANLNQSKANLRLAKVTLERWNKLQKAGVFSQQETDEKQAAFDVREAEVASMEASVVAAGSASSGAEANIRRLEEQKAFGRILAPFDGMITARLMDVGTLVSAGNTGPTREIFRIAQTETMRIFVNVPQTNAATIHLGETANLLVDELPGRVFPARIKRTTNSLDMNTRTMLVILEIPNPQALLRPGMYARVKFSLSRLGSALSIPGDALVMRTDGPQAAVVGEGRRIHYQKLSLGRDYGDRVEVKEGLADGSLVVVNPTDEVREGAVVEVRRKKP